MKKRIRARIDHSEAGASLVEYGLLVAAILVSSAITVMEPVRGLLGF